MTTKKSAHDDFRLRRWKLPPEAFAIAPEKEPDPSDLIDKKTWSSIVTNPDDVSIRTTDHHGTTFRRVYDIWGYWVAFTLDLQSVVQNPRYDALALACLNVGDELQASTHIALTGFYRQAIAGLRSALEGTVVGAYFRAYPDGKKFAEWADGHRGGRLWWREVRKKLGKVSPYSLFEQPDDEFPLLGEAGWVNFLYDRLSTFSHGRPFYTDEDGNQIPTTNVGLWDGSNGPIYERRSVRMWSVYYFDVALACLSIVGLAEPRVLHVRRPTELTYLDFVSRLAEWTEARPGVVEQVIRYLTEQRSR